MSAAEALASEGYQLLYRREKSLHLKSVNYENDKIVQRTGTLVSHSPKYNASYHIIHFFIQK